MASVPPVEQQLKTKNPAYEHRYRFIALLNQVLLVIERLWSPRTMDDLLRQRFRDAHRALGELRDDIELRGTASQTERVA
jgi:hypothetical protein